MNKLDVLIVSSTDDFGIDLITLGLEKRGIKYFRLNRDKFQEHKITFNIQKRQMLIAHNNNIYLISDEHIKAIYYRAPIYLRDIYQPSLNEFEQLYRTQWSAFVRNLSFFETANWINNPEDTFKAENKFLQLKYAESIGFLIPKTLVTNTPENIDFEKMIIKSVDTAIFRVGKNEAFVYSNIVNIDELTYENMSLLPVIAQELIEPKTDVRVTVIGNRAFAVSIIKNGKGLSGDWRMIKENLEYKEITLPDHILNKCLEITQMFNLKFSGIDLVQKDDEYYFIELNPTGEWAWLTNNSQIRIDDAICTYISNTKR